MQIYEMEGQFTLLDLDMESGRTCPAPIPVENPRVRTSVLSSKNLSALRTTDYLFLDLRPGAGNMLGPFWELNALSLFGHTMHNTGECPSAVVESTLSQILQDIVPQRYYLSRTACLGILRRAKARGKDLPPQLKAALEVQAGIV